MRWYISFSWSMHMKTEIMILCVPDSKLGRSFTQPITVICNSRNDWTKSALNAKLGNILEKCTGKEILSLYNCPNKLPVRISLSKRTIKNINKLFSINFILLCWKLRKVCLLVAGFLNKNGKYIRRFRH